MDHLIGQTLNRYKILSLLGEGGMGAVFKSHDLTLERNVAVKVLYPQFAKLPNFQERFLQEARSAARLDHPCIVQVHDFGQDRSFLYIVMEFIPGDNLESLLRDLRDQKKWIPLGEAVLLIRQLALALDYAHKQGVLHRDIKPSNVMLEPETLGDLPYRPVLTDLGLAKLAEGGILTQDGVFLGTPAYMSPEQASGKNTDERSDVYSLGILLFELCTGQKPFPAKTITEAIKYHVQTPAPSPRSIRPDLPEALDAVILKCLEKEPDKRYPRAGELAEVLKALAPQTATIASAPASLGQTVSLFTQYQQALANQPSPSFAKEEALSPGRPGDHILLRGHDGSSRSIPITTGSMVIGRDSRNEIPLTDPKASRQHTRIDFDGVTYRVVDLNSRNGTYFGDRKLLPGVPEVWPPGTTLRIGDTWLRLASAGSPSTVPSSSRAATVPIDSGGSTILRSDGTTVSAEMLKTSAGQRRVAVYVESAQISVDPGGTVAIPVILLNQGAEADRFKLSITGIPANWLTYPDQAMRVIPGVQQNLTINVHPPHNPQSRAGRYSLSLRVISQSVPQEAAEVKATLTVTAFSQFTCEVRPLTLQSGEVGQVHIRNQGNTQESFRLRWEDPDGELAFNPPELRLNVLEGQAAVAEFRAETRRARWFGGEQAHTFIASVEPGLGQPQSFEGEILSRGMVPIWIFPAMIFGCLVLAGVILLFSGLLVGGTNRATQSVVAAQTELAQVVASTNQAATATAAYLANANQATLAAITATANWLALDDDHDGLPNGKELELHTLYNKADTDGDGIADGDEINRTKTDPLNPDTDGDGLKDGAEIQMGLDPLKADTDGDGIIDSLDQAPKQTSTPTANLSLTLVAAFTQTAAAQQGASAATQTAQAAYATQTAQAVYAQQTAQSFFATATAQSATLTAGAYIPQNWTHAVNLTSNRTIYNLRLIGPGQIRVRANWSGTQDTLALIINGPGQVGYYAREDGLTGLEVAYTVSPADFAAGDGWRVSIASFGTGDASGTVEISYPSGASVSTFTNDFTISPTSARSVSLLVLKHNGPVNAQALWAGIPATLSLIVNGPGQVGFYARQDGGSPLSVSYTVTPADLSAGNLWTVSMASFSDANLDGSISFLYP